MPPSFAAPAPLAPGSERQAFIIALAETGNPDVAEQLVLEALETLGNTLPATVPETNARFFLLLISGLVDHHWQRHCWKRPLSRLLGSSPSASSAVWTHLETLPVSLRRSYLLRRLTPLNLEQIAGIVEQPVQRVRHPLWPLSCKQAEVDPRRHYRRLLRRLAASLARLEGTASPARLHRLLQARRRALATPTDAEHRVLYLWQQAMKRQFLPTGVATLLLVAVWLLGTLVYF